MKRWLLLALLCVLSPLGLRAQVTVSGNLKDAGLTNITSLNSYVRFTLAGYGSNIPRVAGSNTILTPYKDFHPDASGNISGTIQGNDTITIGGNSSPGGTWYSVCLYDKGIQFRCATYTITTGTFNLNSAIPNSTTPTVPAPTGDGTYIRKDGGNNPVTGNINFSSINNVIYADQQTGSDFSLKLQAAIALATAAGGSGVVNACGFSGIQTMTVNPFAGVTAPLTVYWPDHVTGPTVPIEMDGAHQHIVACNTSTSGVNNPNLIGNVPVATVTSCTLTSNVNVCSATNTFTLHEPVCVFGTTNASTEGCFFLTAASSSSFSYSITHANTSTTGGKAAPPIIAMGGSSTSSAPDMTIEKMRVDANNTPVAIADYAGQELSHVKHSVIMNYTFRGIYVGGPNQPNGTGNEVFDENYLLYSASATNPIGIEIYGPGVVSRYEVSNNTIVSNSGSGTLGVCIQAQAASGEYHSNHCENHATNINFIGGTNWAHIVHPTSSSVTVTNNVVIDASGDIVTVDGGVNQGSAATIVNNQSGRTLTGNLSYYRTTSSGAEEWCTDAGVCSHSGTETFANLNGVIYVGGSVPQVGGSADMGAQINAAYALLPANGGIITLLPQASGACYNYSTPIVMTTVGKFAILQGLGVNAFTASNFTGPCLNYTPTTATKAISIDWGAAGGSGNTPGSGLRDFTLINNACSTAGGCGSSAIGVDIGATNGGLGENGIFSNVQVMGFGTGYKREDSSGVSWGTKWINSPVRFNTTGILSLASENDNYTDGAINSNGTGVNLSAFGAELTVSGGSCDANTTACVTLANGAILHTSDLHWENTGGSTSHFVTSGSAGSFLDIKGGTMFDDTAVGTTDNYFTAGIISAKGLILQSSGRTISGGSVFNCLTTCDINVIAGNSTLPQSVLLNTSSVGNISGAIVGNRFAQYAGPVTASSLISAQGTACTNGELALSAGWQSTGSATVTNVAGNGQTCEWTITTGTTTAANPTVTDTLTNTLPNATTVCEMIITGGNRTPAAGDGFDQTTRSATAPVFTFQGTPTAGGKTYQVVRRCGP